MFRHGNVQGGAHTVPHYGDLGNLSDGKAIKVHGKLANVGYRLVAEGSDHVTDLHASLGGRRIGNHIFDEYAAVIFQLQALC